MRVDFSYSRIFKFLFLTYLVISILYIFLFFYGSPHKTHDKLTPVTPSKVPQHTQPSVEDNKNEILWANNQGSTVPLSESYVYSKLFSETMQPTNLKPYYYRMEPAPSPDDITVATLITADRFQVFEKLVNNYKGPISVALHISDDHNQANILRRLDNMYQSNPLMKKYVDIHLIIDKFERQFNYWRNVARFFSRTDYFLLLDIDFYLCTDFRQSLQNHPELMNRLKDGNVAIVLPAFEYDVLNEGRDAKVFPRVKSDLVKLVDDKKVSMFHKGWTRGHGSSNYTHWYQADTPYTVTEYNFSYEPYVIVKKDGIPWCNERFIGYGGNKAACLFEIYLSGVDYWVLPQDFIIHQNHDYLEDTRRIERNFNKKVYQNFREEACFRYFRNFLSRNEWGTPKADNLKKECSKSVPNFLKDTTAYQSETLQ
ncbi:hypothetical protein K7432_002962 [Basidiobolus ranarum]|uniref:Glycosyltransferase family 49 protein n=1 Tax=Basidiobolus ranarum TaxID=34480 RepID=A0ABR2W794_9FUNG